jgi:hypothetical protein
VRGGAQAYGVSNDTTDEGFLNSMDAYVKHTSGIFWINVMGTSFNGRYGPLVRPRFRREVKRMYQEAQWGTEMLNGALELTP